MSNDSINSILDTLSEKERKYALEILKEYSDKGSSETYNNLLYEDYEEVPVDITEFLHNPIYLGKGLVNDEGKFTVYDYWVDTLKKIFPDPLLPAQYNTLALTGAIGLGKSFMAVLCALYELYRMLCLKDPYIHYGLQPIDKISFAIMNITLDAAQGVGWDKLQQLAQSSEWFLAHGELSKSNNPVWSPGKKIELICGSLSRHIIGRAVFFCLDGDTEILTNFGDKKLKELVDSKIKVATVNSLGDVEYSEQCTVKPTAIQTEEYEIELEDGTIIKCTPEHRFLLTNGTYKEAQHLTEQDDIFYAKFFGYVYKFTNLETGKIYIGKREKPVFDESYYGSGKLWKESIKNLDKSKIKREVIAWANNKHQLNELEKHYIKLYNSQDPQIGYNIHKGGQGGNSLNDREAWSRLHLGSKNGRYGKPVSEDTRNKISKANRGKIRSKELRQHLHDVLIGVPKPAGHGQKVSQALTGKPKRLSQAAVKNIRETNKTRNTGSHIFNNGLVDIRVPKDGVAPDGFVMGSLRKGKKIKRAKTNGRKWYNDGNVEIYILGEPPCGFTEGRCPMLKQKVSAAKLKKRDGVTDADI